MAAAASSVQAAVAMVTPVLAPLLQSAVKGVARAWLWLRGTGTEVVATDVALCRFAEIIASCRLGLDLECCSCCMSVARTVMSWRLGAWLSMCRQLPI